LQRDHYIATFKYKDFPFAIGPDAPMSRNNSEEAEIRKWIDEHGLLRGCRSSSMSMRLGEEDAEDRGGARKP
jgi:hypothetical protein